MCALTFEKGDQRWNRESGEGPRLSGDGRDGPDGWGSDGEGLSSGLFSMKSLSELPSPLGSPNGLLPRGGSSPGIPGSKAQRLKCQ